MSRPRALSVGVFIPILLSSWMANANAASKAAGGARVRQRNSTPARPSNPVSTRASIVLEAANSLASGVLERMQNQDPMGAYDFFAQGMQGKGFHKDEYFSAYVRIAYGRDIIRNTIDLASIRKNDELAQFLVSKISSLGLVAEVIQARAPKTIVAGSKTSKQVLAVKVSVPRSATDLDSKIAFHTHLDVEEVGPSRYWLFSPYPAKLIENLQPAIRSGGETFPETPGQVTAYQRIPGQNRFSSFAVRKISGDSSTFIDSLNTLNNAELSRFHMFGRGTSDGRASAMLLLYLLRASIDANVGNVATVYLEVAQGNPAAWDAMVSEIVSDVSAPKVHLFVGTGGVVTSEPVLLPLNMHVEISPTAGPTLVNGNQNIFSITSINLTSSNRNGSDVRNQIAAIAHIVNLNRDKSGTKAKLEERVHSFNQEHFANYSEFRGDILSVDPTSTDEKVIIQANTSDFDSRTSLRDSHDSARDLFAFLNTLPVEANIFSAVAHAADSALGAHDAGATWVLSVIRLREARSHNANAHAMELEGLLKAGAGSRDRLVEEFAIRQRELTRENVEVQMAIGGADAEGYSAGYTVGPELSAMISSIQQAAQAALGQPLVENVSLQATSARAYFKPSVREKGFMALCVGPWKAIQTRTYNESASLDSFMGGIDLFSRLIYRAKKGWLKLDVGY